MKYVDLPDGSQLPVLGLGTWDIGGSSTANYSRDEELVETLRTIIRMGYTHLDTAEYYAQGHTEELVGRAMSGFDRAELFITTKVSPSHLRADDVEAALERSLERLNTDYIDLYLIHWPNPDIPLAETFRGFNKIVADGRVRRVGVSNFDLPLVRESMRLSETPIITNQVRYNLLSREYVQNGVLGFCQENGIILTAYSPLKSGVLSHPTVIEIARKYSVSPAEVAIQWLVRQPYVITIPKSVNQSHLQNNLDALDLALTAEDIAALDRIG